MLLCMCCVYVVNIRACILTANVVVGTYARVSRRSDPIKDIHIDIRIDVGIDRDSDIDMDIEIWI